MRMRSGMGPSRAIGVGVALMALLIGARAMGVEDLQVLEERHLGTDDEAQQGIVRAGANWVTSKGNRILFTNDGRQVESRAPKRFHLFDSSWRKVLEAPVEYAGSGDIEHIGDVAYDGQHVWAPASDYWWANPHADTAHILKVDPQTLAVLESWDVSSAIVDASFGDFAGLAWHEGLLYAVEWQDDGWSSHPRLFTFQLQGGAPVLIATYEIASELANGIACRDDSIYVSHGGSGDYVNIDRYALSALSPTELNTPLDIYRTPIDSAWNLLHAEGLTIDGSDVWIAANDYAVRIESPFPPPCPWDVDGSGVVGLGDLNALLSNWGACPPPPDDCPWDFAPEGGDGTIGLGDLNALLSNWGPCPGK
jgi:glutamine cyclotransferase